MLRAGVLERIRAACDASLIAVIAPGGYGKTTVLSQSRLDDRRPTAWLSLDSTHNDPAVLLASLWSVLLAEGVIDEIDTQPLASEEVLTLGVPRLVAALRDRPGGGRLLVDQADALRSRSSLDVVSELVTLAPPGFQVLLASRSASGLPIALLRSQGRLAEIGAADLAMDEAEALVLLAELGLDVGDDLARLLERTEGWPAAIYLSALALRSGAAATSIGDVAGHDRFLADYLRQEVLDPLSPADLQFLVRTSILDRMSGPVCDHILETEGSSRVLARLEDSNLLVTALDRSQTWYRYHALLRDFLTAELHKHEPHLLPGLHARAASWFEEHGFPELAIDHARAAGDTDRTAALVSRSLRVTYARGRTETLTGWLDWLEAEGVCSRHPSLAAAGSFVRSLEGDAGGADRLAAYAFADSEGNPLADDVLEPLALLLRSSRAPKGPELAVEDARAAQAGLARHGDWFHIAVGMEATALRSIGDIEQSDSVWARGITISQSVEAAPFTSQGLGQRASLAAARNDWESAEAFATQALEMIERLGLGRHITSALPLAMGVRLAARAGHVDEAKALMGKASQLRPRLNHAVPIGSLLSLHEMARAFMEMADMAGARRVVREAGDILVNGFRSGALASAHERLKERLAAMPGGAVGPSSLSSAELRLLPMLVTHLTYPEIGERLYLSRHTVKSQAMSIYRKLGVSSRAEAVETARSIGLISL